MPDLVGRRGLYCKRPTVTQAIPSIKGCATPNRTEYNGRTRQSGDQDHEETTSRPAQLLGIGCPGRGRDRPGRTVGGVGSGLCHHNAWKDFRSGIVLSRCDICCNLTPLDQIAATLEPPSKDPNLAEIMDLFTHEQYFWPFYVNYIPDHAQRLDATIRWVTEHGYKPVFYHEGFLGAPA